MIAEKDEIGSPPLSDTTPTSDRSVIVADRLTKTFESKVGIVTALNSMSVNVATHSITGLVGPDGAGKSTFMRLAAGLLRPNAGSITVLGHDMHRDPLSAQRSIGYMPQRFGLYEDLTVQENLDFFSDLQGVPTQSRATHYEELMQMTGLSPFMKRLAGKLSGGMKQKLGLACTLLHAPKLLLLDEPTVGVDPVSRRELWAIIDRFVKKEGASVLLSTAYFDEAERCDDVILLDEGTLIGQRSPSEFSAPLRGRTFKVHATGRKNRDVQEWLSARKDVIDSVIQGDAVRLVVSAGTDPSKEKLFPDEKDIHISSVPPRFEDAFVDALQERHNSNVKQKSDESFPEPGNPSALFDGEATVINVRSAERRFGDFYAVKDLSFDVMRGEIFGLLGANGAGKTTMFRMLCGLLPASGGTLDVAGINVRKAAAAARARIGYMSQKFSLYGTLSVGDNLRFFASAYGLKGPRRRDRMDWAIDEFDLSEVLDDNSGTLPLGYKQRLALACALMHEPDILFLDEPTSGVDPLTRRAFWHRINVLSAKGVTVLVTTHFMEEAEYCDRVAIMMAGELLALGTPSEIKQQATAVKEHEPTMEDAFIHLIEAHE
jgi:drug efflux transport system ATP-binding protein